MHNGVEGELRLADLATFLAIVRSGSVSGAARSLGVTPSQASKAVARLERQLNARLLVRGARGVAASEVGERLLPRIDDVLSRSRALKLAPEQVQPELTVVASASLTALLLPVIVQAQMGLRVRSLELPPGVASAWASGHTFDVALTTGSERWPASWVRAKVGAIRKALFTTPATAERLGPPPVDPLQLAEVPFISPIYGHQGQVVIGDDGCPLSHDHRRVGHETQTLNLALELAAATGQLVFGPALSARAHVLRGALVEVEVAGWEVSDSLHLVCAAERVQARVQRQLLTALRAALTLT